MASPAFERGDRVAVQSQVPDHPGWLWATVLGRISDGQVHVEFDDAQHSRASLPVEIVFHPSTAVAGPIVAEVMAQLEELSDDTCAALAVLAGDPEREARLVALADDLRETLIATLDVRVADWCADNAGALS